MNAAASGAGTVRRRRADSRARAGSSTAPLSRGAGQLAGLTRTPRYNPAELAPLPAVLMSSPFDARTLVRAMQLFGTALEEHREELNSLNVYPVPDGDTGTNLSLTARSVADAIRQLDGDAVLFETVASTIARASLMGARGNSGVILSQILRGLCEALPSTGHADGKGLAAALEHASYEAYRAVAKPAEGTMLSVLRDAKTAARESSRMNGDCGTVLTAALVAARDSLERTREVHEDLKRANVVDAGGKGVVILLDALRAAVTGQEMTERVGPFGPVGREESPREGAPSTLSFEVQYLLQASDDDVSGFRRELDQLGDSIVVVGGGGLFNVHVHTDDEDSVVGAARRVGDVHDVVVTSLADQIEACMAGEARAVRVAEQTSVVAVAEGQGIVGAFRSLGAVVVTGGPGNNPSVEELVRAIDAAPADAVLVLPNHRNVIPAAERAAAQSSKEAVVVPARSIASGLSAAAAFNSAADADENARALKEVLSVSRSGELVRAERDATTPAGVVRSGDWIGSVEGEVVYAGASLEDAAAEVGRRLGGADAELLTLIVGADVHENDEERVRTAMAGSLPDLRLEVVSGGQPRYPFLIGVE